MSRGVPTPEAYKRMVLGAGARQIAMRRLADAHPDEFDELLAEERHKRGLSQSWKRRTRRPVA